MERILPFARPINRRRFLGVTIGAALAITSEPTLVLAQTTPQPETPTVVDPKPGFVRRLVQNVFRPQPPVDWKCEPAELLDRGKAGFYTEADEGCQGCREDRVMANGEVLKDNQATLAHNRIPMNTPVIVINRDNGKSVAAIVTDKGNFEPKRMADLSLSLAQTLDLRTDESTIEIRSIKCAEKK